MDEQKAILKNLDDAIDKLKEKLSDLERKADALVDEGNEAKKDRANWENTKIKWGATLTKARKMKVQLSEDERSLKRGLENERTSSCHTENIRN